ncbi:MAG: flavodoxin [Bacteroides sp.]|uniref:flavodoxin n=2 Tax=unclassified Bacteroides TaxID=2646097 RepID=UPI0026DEBBAA|nr:flavodoxin [Bacteroides sp.]MDO5419413.1 flavodoxin [Bacteroides sp.]
MDLQIIQNKIFEVRGCRVMLDYHLAELYQVETRALKQAVKRNIERFPGDFMFVLTQEVYEIQPAKKYTAADLDWHDKASRSSVEMSDSKSRPALYSKLGSLAEYDTIYIGFPIWWNLAPRIINTFIESGDFAGKTVIPFATSGSSSISNAEKELQTNYPGINWGKGRLLNGASRETVKQWIKK